MTCPECKVEYCIACKNGIHVGQTCEEAQQEMDSKKIFPKEEKLAGKQIDLVFERKVNAE